MKIKIIFRVFIILLLPLGLYSQEAFYYKKIKQLKNNESVFNSQSEKVKFKNKDQFENITTNKIKLAINNNILSKDSNYIIKYSTKSGLPNYVETKEYRRAQIKTLSLDTNIKKTKFTENQLKTFSINYLNEINHILNINNINDFHIVDSKADEVGKYHIKFQQYYEGFKIDGNEIIVHLNSLGIGELFNGYYDNDFHSNNANFKVSLNEALDIVDKKINTDKSLDSIQYENGLNLYIKTIVDTVWFKNSDNSTLQLAYHILRNSNFLERFEIYIDINSGNILQSNIITCSIADLSQTYTGIDLNGNSRQINVDFTNGYYLLKDISKGMYNSTTGKGYIQLYDAYNTSPSNKNFNYGLVYNTTNSWTGLQISGMANLSKVYDFYKNNYSRTSLDNNGGNLYAMLNVADKNGLGLDNAYYTNGIMFFGNGYNFFKPLAASLDITAHEMTHGVVEKTANLKYYSQSGALNESFADIFGVTIDSTNWLIGDDVIFKNNISNALRSLSDPHNNDKNTGPLWQPKFMYEYVNKTSDNGGVHTNSGIPNFAFYLMATSNNMNRLKASKIYYYALSNYLTNNSNFTDLRLAVVKSAQNLYGTTEALLANIAFDSVGIFDGVSPSIEKKLIPNTGPEILSLYGVNKDTTLYLDSISLKAIIKKNINSKISITDDGKYGVFVGSDKKIYYTTLTYSKPVVVTLLQNDTIWDNVAISRDGRRLAATTIYADTSINVYDFNKKKWYTYYLYNPNYTDSTSSNPPLYADSFEWDYTSENIFYDCYNELKSTNKNQNINYWNISSINVWNTGTDTIGSGKVTQYFNLYSGQNIGNPSFAKNSPDIFVFDYFDSTFNIIYAYNIRSSKLGFISNNNTFGYPNYNKDDSKIAFNAISSNNIDVIKTINLNSDKINSTGTTSVLYNYAQLPVYFSVGNRNFIVPSQPQISTSRSSNLCTGDSLIMTSSVSTGNQWLRNGYVITGATNKTYTTSTPGNYTVYATQNGISGDVSEGVYVTMNTIPNNPTLLRDTSNYLISSNNSGNFWYKDNNLLTDTSKKLKINTSGLYTVYTQNNGCVSKKGASYYFITTDILNLPNNQMIKISPNPVFNQLYIDFSLIETEFLNAELFNVSNGKKIKIYSKIHAGMGLNFTDVPSGIYLLKLYNPQNIAKNYNFKIVKI